jgi:RNA-directed DNA polymerase
MMFCLARLWAWILWLFARKSVRREAPLLLGDGGDVDQVHENVDLTGAPKTVHHRRKLFRDPRLLPKRDRASRWIRRQKRELVMDSAEARRLFSSSLRTRNRGLRDLATDEEQLARHGLPVWKTEQDVAAALGVSVGRLRFFTMHRAADPVCHYVLFRIPKRSGGMRLIMAPKRELKALQRKLHELLGKRLPVGEHAHGFVSGRSVLTNARPHVGKTVLVQFDLKDFFPSVTYARVRGLLCALGYSFPIASVIALLATEAERQVTEVDGRRYYVPVGWRHCVQGAPTSPAFCNAVALKLDHRLAGLARRLGFSYTRYADDLTFSGDDPARVHQLIKTVSRIVRAEGFVLNTSKTRVSRRGSRQRVTGVTVNEEPGLSRKERRRLRAALHAQGGNPSSELRGKLAWLSMLNPAQAAALARRAK